MSYKPKLTKGQIEWANKQTLSAMAAAKVLGVSYNKYKKYANLYGILLFIQKVCKSNILSNVFKIYVRVFLICLFNTCVHFYITPIMFVLTCDYK